MDRRIEGGGNAGGRTAEPGRRRTCIRLQRIRTFNPPGKAAVKLICPQLPCNRCRLGAHQDTYFARATARIPGQGGETCLLSVLFALVTLGAIPGSIFTILVATGRIAETAGPGSVAFLEHQRERDNSQEKQGKAQG